MLDYVNFARRPFVLDAVEITEENIAEVAELVGTIETRENGDRYIRVDPSKMQMVSFVYLGWWFTNIENHYRAYKPHLFHSQFVVINDDNRDSIHEMNEEPR